jgi:hypothetical protein
MYISDNLHDVMSRATIRAEIDAQVQSYLASGGEIVQLAITDRAIEPLTFTERQKDRKAYERRMANAV